LGGLLRLGMKKLILISALLFSFNGWCDDTYLSCDCIVKTSRTENVNFNDFYSGDCQSLDEKKIAVILNKEKKYLSYPGDHIFPIPIEKYVETDLFYTRKRSCSPSVQFCETWRLLNRVTLILEDFDNWDESTKGTINPRSKNFISKKYQCSIKDKL
jgi:hypothetical protein